MKRTNFILDIKRKAKRVIKIYVDDENQEYAMIQEGTNSRIKQKEEMLNDLAIMEDITDAIKEEIKNK